MVDGMIAYDPDFEVDPTSTSSVSIGVDGAGAGGSASSMLAPERELKFETLEDLAALTVWLKRISQTEVGILHLLCFVLHGVSLSACIPS